MAVKDNFDKVPPKSGTGGNPMSAVLAEGDNNSAVCGVNWQA